MPPVPRAVASSGLGEAGGAEAGHQLDPGAQRAGPGGKGRGLLSPDPSGPRVGRLRAGLRSSLFSCEFVGCYGSKPPLPLRNECLQFPYNIGGLSDILSNFWNPCSFRVMAGDWQLSLAYFKTVF